MKKVRVIKEMPFAKVGDIFGINKGRVTYLSDVPIHDGNLDFYVDNGWLEWVEEPKSLGEKLMFEIRKNKVRGLEVQVVDFSKIAHNHYKELFENNISESEEIYFEGMVSKLRKALFGGDND